ncbi:MAG: SxtJ family membrane protein, partial [Planctomycetaceae bacterium]
WLNSKGYGTFASFLIGFSALVAIVGLVKPHLTAPLYALWMLAAFPIGWVMSYVVASLVYFLVVTPIGLLTRLVRRDPMGRRFDPSASTYWSKVAPTKDSKQYFRQF